MGAASGRDDDENHIVDEFESRRERRALRSCVRWVLGNSFEYVGRSSSAGANLPYVETEFDGNACVVTTLRRNTRMKIGGARLDFVGGFFLLSPFHRQRVSSHNAVSPVDFPTSPRPRPRPS